MIRNPPCPIYIMEPKKEERSVRLAHRALFGFPIENFKVQNAF